MSGKVSFKEAVDLWARQRERPPQAHPSLPELLSYHNRQMDEEAMEELRDHISDCTACSRTLLEFSQLEAESQESPLMTPEELQAAWDKMRPRIAEEAIQPPPQDSPHIEGPASDASASKETASETVDHGVERASRATSPRRLWLHRASQVCAMLFPLLLGWSIYLMRENARPPAPVGIGGLDQIQLQGGDTRSESAEIRIEDHGDSGHLLVLRYQGDKSFPRYAIEILDQTGKEQVWIIPNLAPLEFGDFYVAFPQGSLDSGHYLLRLHGVEEGQLTVLTENDLQVD